VEFVRFRETNKRAPCPHAVSKPRIFDLLTLRDVQRRTVAIFAATVLGSAQMGLAQTGDTPAPDRPTMTLEQIETAYNAGDLAAARAGIATFAEDGLAVAQYRLGFMLANGEGGPADRQGAIRWLEAAQAQQHAPAAMLLARVYLSGNPEEPEYVRAAELLSGLAEAGEADAIFMLAQLYRAGRGVEGDPVRAAQLLDAVARQGLLPAQFMLAQMYSAGEGVEADAAQAARWLFQAADGGYGPAQMALYRNYAEGLGFPQDMDKALDWLKAAADGGFVEGEHTLGASYLLGGGGLDTDPIRGIGYVVRAAEKGHPGAQSNLGYAYYTGTGVPQDFDKAFVWYKRAADQGLARAAVVVGTMLKDGNGTDRDLDQAVLYLRFADSRGNVAAAQTLGVLIAAGEVPPSVNPELAASWVAQAAEAGSEDSLAWLIAQAEDADPLARFLLGALYYQSGSVPRNPDAAVRHMRIAAEADVVPAQYHMGLFHAEGFGVEQSLVKAHVWMNIAAANGNDAAARKRDDYAALMTPEEIAEAQERARGRLRGDK